MHKQPTAPGKKKNSSVGLFTSHQTTKGSFHAHRIRRDLSDFFKIWCVCKRAPSDMVVQKVFFIFIKTVMEF
jgi:hypothetical protein